MERVGLRRWRWKKGVRGGGGRAWGREWWMVKGGRGGVESLCIEEGRGGRIGRSARSVEGMISCWVVALRFMEEVGGRMVMG